MGGTYRELDHPADLLLEVRGGSFAEVVENALYALYDCVVDVEAVRPEERIELEAGGADAAQALRALLAEALFLLDTEEFVGAAARVEARVGPGTTAVLASVWGERLDRDRHGTKAEVKAVTYHGLAVEQDAGGGWLATVLLDV